MSDEIIVEFDISPRLGIIIVDMQIEIETTEDYTDWINIAYYEGNGNDIGFTRAYDSEEKWIGWTQITHDPELEYLGQNIILEPIHLLS